MKSNGGLQSACVLSLLMAAGYPPAAAEELRNHFDADAVLGTPAFFDLIVLGEPGAARWLVTIDTNPPSMPNRLLQANPNRPAGSVAAALRRNVAFQDGSASTFVKTGPGHAGLLLRLEDAKNFLLLLADTESGELVLTSYRGGKANELGRGRRAFHRGWEKIGAALAGPVVSVAVNDEKLFEATDPKPRSGRIGAATVGPGAASFDDLVIVDRPGSVD